MTDVSSLDFHVPYGYEFGEVNVDKDLKTIHESWEHFATREHTQYVSSLNSSHLFSMPPKLAHISSQASPY